MKLITVNQIDLKDNCKHVVIHQFPLPEFNDDGFYRTVTSYSAFFESRKRRNWSENYLYVAGDTFIEPSEYEVKRNATLPVIQHSNLINFFGYIGYDRKKKTFYNIKKVFKEWQRTLGDKRK